MLRQEQVYRLPKLRELLIKQNVKEEALKAIDGEVKAVVTKATEFAQTSLEPDPSELFTDILLPAGGRDSRQEA